MICCAWSGSPLRSPSRRRLHPLFALATVVADVSGGVTRAAVRSGMRTAGATLVTMATWMLPRR